jgi:hypothetical protein
MTTIPSWNKVKTRLEELGYSLTLEQFKNCEIEIKVIETGQCSYTFESIISRNLEDIVDVDDVLLYDVDEEDLQSRISDNLRDSGDIWDGHVVERDYEDHDADEYNITEVTYTVRMEDGERINLQGQDIADLIRELSEGEE